MDTWALGRLAMTYNLRGGHVKNENKLKLSNILLALAPTPYLESCSIPFWCWPYPVRWVFLRGGLLRHRLLSASSTTYRRCPDGGASTYPACRCTLSLCYTTYSTIDSAALSREFQEWSTTNQNTWIPELQNGICIWYKSMDRDHEKFFVLINTWNTKDTF